VSLKRLKELQGRIAEAGIDVVAILYSRDLYYFTGTAQPCVLLVSPREFHLFIRRGYERAVADTGNWLEARHLSNEGRLDAIANKLREWKITKGVLGMELDTTPAEIYLEWQKLLPEFRLVDISPLVLEQRKTKDVEEIACIRQACTVVDAGHRRALEVLREGITELEFAAAIEDAHRRAGHEGLSFFRRPDFFMSRGPVGSGANLMTASGIVYSIAGVGMSAALPVGPSMKKIEKGEPIVIDIPTLYQGYHGDQSRTYVMGKASDGLRSLHSGLKDISDRIISNMTPGKTCKELFHLAWGRARELKVDDCFMSFGKRRNTNFIGHGVGLECNEPPMLAANDNSKLEVGYTLALDIHMLREGVGAVKLEDTILVTETGAEILTLSPRELFEVGG